MAINKLISVKEAILESFEDMGVDITRDKPTFTMWAVRAEKDIGSYYSYKKQIKVITASNCTAKLPVNAAYLKMVVMGDHGCNCDALFNSLSSCGCGGTFGTFSPTDVFLVIDPVVDGNGTASFGGCGNPWEVQGGNIVFGKSIDGQKITVQYLGLQEDSEGFVMVSENHKPAIIEYIKWKFAERSRFSPLKMELGDIAMHKQEYFRLVSDARAMDGEMTESDRAQTLSLLHDPFSGWGLSIGMPLVGGSNYYSY